MCQFFLCATGVHIASGKKINANSQAHQAVTAVVHIHETSVEQVIQMKEQHMSILKSSGGVRAPLRTPLNSASNLK